MLNHDRNKLDIHRYTFLLFVFSSTWTPITFVPAVSCFKQFLEPHDNLFHCDLLQLPLAYSDSYKTINLTLIISWLTTYYRGLRKLCTLYGTLTPTSLWANRFTYSIIPMVTLSLLEISHFAGFFLYSRYLMIIKHITRCISINLTGTSFNISALNS